MELRLPVHRRSLRGERIRRALVPALDPAGTKGGIIALGHRALFSLVGDRAEVTDIREEGFWVCDPITGRIHHRQAHEMADATLDRCGRAMLLLGVDHESGCQVLAALGQEMNLGLATDGDRDVLHWPHGVVVLGRDLASRVYEAASGTDLSSAIEIAARSQICILLDTGASRHDQLATIAGIEIFLNSYVPQVIEDNMAWMEQGSRTEVPSIIKGIRWCVDPSLAVCRED